MTFPAELRFKLAPRDLSEAQLAHLRSSRMFLLMFAVGVVNLAFAGVAFAGAPANVPGYILPLLAGLFFTAGLPLVAWVSAPAAFRRQPALGDDVQLTVTEAGLAVRGAAAAGEERWPLYTSYLETRHLFLLYHGPRTFRLVPKRAFASPADVEAFRDLVVDKVGRLRREWVM
ncbi:MAG TPA: YcxB family protein [Humisphaera sp.]